MSLKTKRLVAAGAVAISLAAVPTVQAITATGGLPIACAGGGGTGCSA